MDADPRLVAFRFSFFSVARRRPRDFRRRQNHRTRHLCRRRIRRCVPRQIRLAWGRDVDLVWDRDPVRSGDDGDGILPRRGGRICIGIRRPARRM